jgi:hypothetical protein
LDATAFKPKNMAETSAAITATSQACLDVGLDGWDVCVIPLSNKFMGSAFCLKFAQSMVNAMKWRRQSMATFYSPQRQIDSPVW